MDGCLLGEEDLDEEEGDVEMGDEVGEVEEGG